LNLPGQNGNGSHAMIARQPRLRYHRIYVALHDVDSHYHRARAAGAEIVMEIQDTDYGSRDYSARDLEGNLWHFGTYWPEVSEQD